MTQLINADLFTCSVVHRSKRRDTGVRVWVSSSDSRLTVSWKSFWKKDQANVTWSRYANEVQKELEANVHENLLSGHLHVKLTVGRNL